MISEEFIGKFIRFGVVGIFGTGLDFGATFLSREKFRWDKYLANSIGFMFGATFNFSLNRIWTFHDNNPQILEQYIKFLSIAAIGLIINNFVVFLLNEKKQLPFYISKAGATGIVLFWNFFANYFFTFSQ